MVRNILLKILLFPFSLVYGFFSMLNNLFYDFGILASIKFTLPTINIGNLTVGGTGKTPHIEYLINILNPFINLAVLSRGYMRKTRGFRMVKSNDNVQSVGDEPLLFKKKYPELSVFVSENRVEGVSQLVMEKPEIQTVLLDDAFQHRAINPALNILLTEYEYPFFDDFYLPTGRLREWKSGYKRSDIIIVSKCPQNISEKDRTEFVKKLKLTPKQKVFFSYYKYFNPYYLYDTDRRIKLNSDISVLLISALASTSYLNTYLENTVGDFHSIEFTDHHVFSFDEMEHFKKIYDSLDTKNKIILTTEKDAMRLNEHREYILKNNLPVFVLPVAVDFLFDQKEEFDETIKSFLLDFKS
jgi:tetraacyldisaccharide 4'-kinase